MMGTLNKKAALVGVGIVGLAGIAGSAFAATITVNNGNAGQGVSVTSGYTVTGYKVSAGSWTSGSATATNITQVTFTLTKLVNTAAQPTEANTTVYVQLTGGTASNWALCTIGASQLVTCTIPNKDLSSTTGASIVAYDKT